MKIHGVTPAARAAMVRAGRTAAAESFGLRIVQASVYFTTRSLTFRERF